MNDIQPFDIFLITVPGLEPVLKTELHDLGYQSARAVPGGIELQGVWRDVWNLNLWCRGATRVLARLGAFRVFHLAQLDKRSRKFPWAEILRSDVPVRVEVTCRKSKVYHAKAATQRIETALTESAGIPVSEKADVTIKVRIEDDLCTISVDTSGAPLHKRGHKMAVGKAPMRETMASLFLREAGFDGTCPVLDPMCGSGTFVLEAAEIASGLAPGRTRSFAFEQLKTFDDDLWQSMRAGIRPTLPSGLCFYGSDRDAGAVERASSNAEAAGVSAICRFAKCAVADLQRPEGPPGIVIVNPPYGGRIGNKKLLYALYGAFGQVMKERFAGWRVSIITTEQGLARATGLPLLPPGPIVTHGGLKIRHYRTDPL